MKNLFDYSKYECPFAHLPKDCGHELKGPEGYEGTHGVWCACGFRGPVFYLDPKDLNLKELEDVNMKEEIKFTGCDENGDEQEYAMRLEDDCLSIIDCIADKELCQVTVRLCIFN